MKDKYVYPNTNILINKENIRSQQKLDYFESTVFNLALIKLQEDGILINSTADIFLIHELLFGEVYEWAGKPREINIYKEELVINNLSVEYEDHTRIRNKINELDRELKNLCWDDPIELVENLADYLAKLWKIHPFREGNTRAVVTYLFFLITQNKYSINIELIGENAKYFRNALVMASIGEYSETHHLKEILTEAIFINEEGIISPRANTEKYSTINNLDMVDYKYNYHMHKV